MKEPPPPIPGATNTMVTENAQVHVAEFHGIYQQCSEDASEIDPATLESPLERMNAKQAAAFVRNKREQEARVQKRLAKTPGGLPTSYVPKQHGPAWFLSRPLLDNPNPSTNDVAEHVREALRDAKFGLDTLMAGAEFLFARGRFATCFALCAAWLATNPAGFVLGQPPALGSNCEVKVSSESAKVTGHERDVWELLARCARGLGDVPVQIRCGLGAFSGVPMDPGRLALLVDLVLLPSGRLESALAVSWQYQRVRGNPHRAWELAAAALLEGESKWRASFVPNEFGSRQVSLLAFAALCEAFCVLVWSKRIVSRLPPPFHISALASEPLRPEPENDPWFYRDSRYVATLAAKMSRLWHSSITSESLQRDISSARAGFPEEPDTPHFRRVFYDWAALFSATADAVVRLVGERPARSAAPSSKALMAHMNAALDADSKALFTLCDVDAYFFGFAAGQLQDFGRSREHLEPCVLEGDTFASMADQDRFAGL